MDLALTRACNLQCVYCYSQLQKNPGKQWTGDMIESTLSDFADIGVKGVSLVSDGESTCNPRWAEAIVRGKELGLDMALGTNGLAFKPFPEVMRSLTYLRFNMSAADPERYHDIHGGRPTAWHEVMASVYGAVSVKHSYGLPVTIGVQMVLMPQFADQILPLAHAAKQYGVDYFQIKHCSDDESGSLGVDYEKIKALEPLLKEAEELSDDNFQVIVKWRKIRAGSRRTYKRCLAVPFHLQISGSGLVAPCGMFFAEKYEKYHLGNLHDQSFRSIWESERYWEAIALLASDRFNAQVACGCLCLQDAGNVMLNHIRNLSEKQLAEWLEMSRYDSEEPMHVNFI